MPTRWLHDGEDEAVKEEDEDDFLSCPKPSRPTNDPCSIRGGNVLVLTHLHTRIQSYIIRSLCCRDLTAVHWQAQPFELHAFHTPLPCSQHSENHQFTSSSDAERVRHRRCSCLWCSLSERCSFFRLDERTRARARAY